MPRVCTICGHKKRRKIDSAIATGTSYRDIAARFGVSASAIGRHREHVAGAVKRATDKREEDLGESILSRLEGLYKRGQKVLAQAEASQNLFAAVGCIRELRGILGALYELSSTAAQAGDREVKILVHYGDERQKQLREKAHEIAPEQAAGAVVQIRYVRPEVENGAGNPALPPAEPERPVLPEVRRASQEPSGAGMVIRRQPGVFDFSKPL